MPRRSRCVLLTLLALVGCSLAAASGTGTPLPQVLERLRDAGFEVIYSDELVRADMLVETDPDSLPSIGELRRMVARFGLELAEIAPRVLVVRALKPPVEQPIPRDRSPIEMPELLEEVVVTPDSFDLAGEGFEEREVLDAADLASAPLRVGETLSVIEALPGVAIGGEQAAPRIRGSSGRDVLVVMDGLELYQPYHLPDFRSPISLIDPETVDRLEVQTGGMSVEFGDRYGGLVRIETPRVPDQAQRSVALGSASSRLGWTQPIGEGAAFSMSARAWYPNAVDLTVNVGDDEITPRMADLFAKVLVPLGARHTLALHLLGARDRIDYLAKEGDERVDAKARSGYAWGRLTTSWSESVLTEFLLGYGRVERERRGFALGFANEESTIEDIRGLELFTLTGRVTRRVGERHLLTGGLELRRLFADYDYRATVEQGRGATLRRFDLDPEGTTFGAYFSDRMRLGERAVLEFGARWDYQDYTEDKQLSPRVHLALRTGARALLRVSAGRYAQSQRIHELEIEDGVGGFSRAEVSDQLSASLTAGLKQGWTTRAGVFARRLSRLRPRFENLFNPVELLPEVERDRVRIDADRGRAYGLELSLSSPVEKRRIWGQASYTLSRAEDREGGRWVPRSWDQPHALSGWVAGRLSRTSTLTVSLAARSGWPTTPVGVLLTDEGDLREPGEPLPEGRNDERLGDYLRLDARFTYARPIRRGVLRADAGIINLANHGNDCCSDVTVDVDAGSIDQQFESWTGRAWTLSLGWEF